MISRPCAILLRPPGDLLKLLKGKTPMACCRQSPWAPEQLRKFVLQRVQNSGTKFKKLNFISEEIIYLKNYSLSLRTPIELFAVNSEKNSEVYFDKKSFENCEISNLKAKKLYIFPSGEVTEFSLNCFIKNELVKINVNSFGRPILDEN